MSETDKEFVERMAAVLETGTRGSFEDFNRLFALARRGAEMQWRPIETAPKDGRWFLAGCEADYDVVGGASFWAGAARFEYPTDDAPELMRSTGYDAGPIAATHWMPLPAPPKGDSDDN